MPENKRTPISPAYLIFALVLCLCLTLISTGLKDVKFASGADEGYYLKYASYIGEHGLGGFPDLFKNFIGDQKNWLFPSPIRMGYIALSSAWLKVFGYSFINLAALSLFSFLIFLAISFYFARKYFNDKIAVLFVTLLAFSPLNMAMARRALLDSTFNLFATLSIWLFFGLLKNRSWSRYFLFIAVYAFTILVKEMAVLLSLFFALYLIFSKFVLKKTVTTKDFLSATVFPLLIAGSAYLIAAGNLSDAVNTVRITLTSLEHNEYLLLFGSGPWFRYIIDYTALSPWVIILSLGFVSWYIAANGRDETVSYLILACAVLFFSINFFAKSVRYVIMLDAPMRLFSVLILNRIFEARLPKYALILTAVSVAAIAVFDYLNFYGLFVSGNIYDPQSYWLLISKHIIPWR